MSSDKIIPTCFTTELSQPTEALSMKRQPRNLRHHLMLFMILHVQLIRWFKNKKAVHIPMFMILHIITGNRIYTYFLRLYVNYCTPSPLVQIQYILNDILGVFIFYIHNNTKKNSLLNDILVVYRLALDLILFVAYFCT